MPRINEEEKRAFSKYLEELITNYSDKKKNEIENISGVKNLTKICKGNYLPAQREVIQRLLKAIECDFNREKRALDLYDRARWGAEVWNIKQFIRETFNVMYEMNESLRVAIVDDELPNKDVLHGKLRIENYLKRLFFKIVNTEGAGKIQILGAGEWEVLFENMASIFQNSAVECEHIVYLRKKDSEGMIQAVRNVVSCSMTIKNYTSIIQYLDNDAQEMNVVITDECALCLFDKFQKCMILRNKDHIRIMQLEFRKSFAGGKKVVACLEDEQKKSVLRELLVLDTGAGIGKDTDSFVQYSLQYQIPIYRWFYIEKVNGKVRLTRRENEGQHHDYISQDGVEQFAKDGKYFDVISGETLQFDDRQKEMVLEILYDTEYNKMQIIDGSQWEIRERTVLICRGNWFNLFTMPDRHGNQITLQICEEEIGKGLVEFMKNLSQYELTLGEIGQKEVLYKMMETCKIR